MNTNKRFVQRKDGAILSGLCNGIAHYVGTDAKYVRLWWLGLSFFIGAKTVLIYAVLMFVVPYDKDETHSTAVIDVQTLKGLIVKGDAQGLRQFFSQMWNDVLRRMRGEASPRAQQS